VTTSIGYVRYFLGTLCLFIATVTAMMTAPAAVLTIFQSEVAPAMTVMLVLVAAFFVLLGTFSWVRAVRLTPGDDLLEGQRGLLIAMMVVTVLLLAGFASYFVLQIDFWRGAIDGMRDGS
jgi:hypothetical protein